jgi:hypothetical protein
MLREASRAPALIKRIARCRLLLRRPVGCSAGRFPSTGRSAPAAFGPWSLLRRTNDPYLTNNLAGFPKAVAQPCGMERVISYAQKL